MLDYVKVLLCVYPGMREYAKICRRAMEYKAIRSHEGTNTEELALELVLLSYKADLYEDTANCIEKILARLPAFYRTMLNCVLYGGSVPEGYSRRTVYRRAERAVSIVGEALGATGRTAAWFSEEFSDDEEMKALLSGYERERKTATLRTSPARAGAACALRSAVLQGKS